MTRIAGAVVLVIVLVGSPRALGQPSSLLKRPAPRTAYKADDVSFIRLPPPAPISLHDLISIQVDETTLQQVNARLNRRRQNTFELSFDEMIVLLSGLRVRPDQAIREQQPGIEFEALNDLRNTMQANRRDRLTFAAQASVVEIKPNGNLVIEANSTIRINNELTEVKLSGLVNPKDVDSQTRTVRSSKIANKVVDLRQIGPTRDALKRGWLTRIMDMFGPF
jgi:flagellar L-ring protein precursor FlgH